jgi:hypothetical protein
VAYAVFLVHEFLSSNMAAIQTRSKLKLHGLSPRANYTDRATAACLRSDWPTFADRGCHVVSVTDPYGRIFGFLDRGRYFFYQVAPQLYSRGRSGQYKVCTLLGDVFAYALLPGWRDRKSLVMSPA